MPRRIIPSTSSATASPTSKSTPLKRSHAASNGNTTSTPASRQSSRLRSSPIAASTTKKATPKKSQFFHQDSTISEPASEIEGEASGYEDEDASASAVSSLPASDSDTASEAEPSSDDDAPRKKRKVARMKGAVVKKIQVKTDENGAVVGSKGQELWRPGVKSKLAPGEALFVPLPKAREEGKIKYRDDWIHENTLLFLGELKRNNDREWLKVHDADYRQSKKDFDSFVECLTEKVIEKDETIPELPPKDLTFRIYRDVRFSSDPTPYKTHFSAAWSRTGRKGPYAAYYVQIAPSGSFLGAGLWHPDAAPLALLRRDIDRKSHKLKQVLLDDQIRKEFLGGAKAKEGDCVSKFAALNKENALKTKPKGYDAENPNITLLKLRNFTIGRKLKDDEIVGQGGLKRIADLIGVLVPFVTYLNSIIMPDNPDGSDSDPEEEGGEDEEDDGAESDVEDGV
ncbi:MAG: hypothetical protein HETSPECPRED_000942 [Heterodermia speciosa]|uniref:Uncharacterized protein n=1 Tax=Heterodermia speciosa TaxID=116794 RepID=A0A8H3ETI2_9LECA|nr:MAG: hypothetical protein HETSPECPRED_000942 [Heterodermia speciosa]